VSDLNKNSKFSFICTFNIINNGKYLQNHNVELLKTLRNLFLKLSLFKKYNNNFNQKIDAFDVVPYFYLSKQKRK
jgi:hypothetical protein